MQQALEDRLPAYVKMAAVDAVDQQLVRALRENGRATYAELARLVGMSGPSVQERVRRLEERGIITGYHASVAPEAVGLGITALVGILPSEGVVYDDVAQRLRDVDAIEDCWFIAGEEAFMLKVRVADMAGLEHLIGELSRTSGVARTRTSVVLSTTWESRIVEAAKS